MSESSFLMLWCFVNNFQFYSSYYLFILDFWEVGLYNRINVVVFLAIFNCSSAYLIERISKTLESIKSKITLNKIFVDFKTNLIYWRRLQSNIHRMWKCEKNKEYLHLSMACIDVKCKNVSYFQKGGCGRNAFIF